MHGHEAPHTPTNGLAVSPGIIRSRANAPRHVYCGHGRPSHLPVPRGRRTYIRLGRSPQFWRLQTIRNGAPCNRRDPHSPTMAVGGQEGSWGIHRYPLPHVQPHRSMATHQKPQLGSGKIWRRNWAEIGDATEGRGCDARPRSTPHTYEWPCSVPRDHPLTGKPIAACVLPPMADTSRGFFSTPSRATRGRQTFRGQPVANLSSAASNNGRCVMQ